ncbi:MAG TPA: PAS domain-containing sensor histidine kinase [Candidatus Saccharimonadales bacterium]|jgi:signal transduction histidine kinase
MPNLSSNAIVGRLSSIEETSIENLPFGYIVTNNNHEIVRINYAARQLLVVSDDIAKLEQVVKKLPEQLQLLDHVKYCSIEHKSCSFREVPLGDRIARVSLSPVFHNDDLEGNVLTLEDVTDAVAKEHARDQFLSFLVHELRTPLTAIHGNSLLIQEYYTEAMKDESLGEMIRDIGSGSENLLTMVSEFLDMGRLEEGRVSYDLKQFEAVGVIRETVRGLGVIAKEHNLSLVFDEYEGSEIQVVGDPVRVAQVLTNLIGNSLKFTETGGITVRLGKDSATDLDILVQDTGPGIPAESREHMFQKYFQAANNKYTRDSSKSTGLGLYITKLMIEGMGGRIRLLDAKPGKGSCFAFTVPLATPDRLKRLEKELYDAKQGVQHAPAADHQSVLLNRPA